MTISSRARFASVLAVIAVMTAACADQAGSDSSEGEAQTGEGGDEFPEEDITLIVPYGAGGSNDVLARTLAPLMAEELGVSIGVENVTGASGAIGLGELYDSDPDGYTMVALTPPNEYIAEVQGLLEIPASEFRMLGAANVDPGMIAVPADSPYESLEELNEASDGGELSVAVHGLASNYTIGALNYMQAAGVDWSLVHHDSGGDITTAVQGGHTDVGVRAGGWYDLHPDDLRVLALTSGERADEFEGVPTVEEVIGEPVRMASLRGFAVHADTPEDRFNVLADAFATAVQSDEFKAAVKDDLGLRWDYQDPEEVEQSRQEAAASVDAVVDQLELEQ